MKSLPSSLSYRRLFGSPSFALISVLALVSLAALTATAFLASARLERTATRPLGERVRLEMALNIGLNCAKEIINDGMGSSYDNIATYWRTNPADDIGYLLLGVPRDAATPRMYWYAAFSTATMTELATNSPPSMVMTSRTTVTNQSMFSNTISTFMASATNFGANGSTNIELIGHTAANPRTSPPVGWMTIKQPVRTTPGKTNTVSTPVMRIAFFTEDLSGLIDAERMCGSTSRDTGTNPTEISMANIGPSPGITFGTSTNQRATYLTPSLLASNGPIATTNLRYFATGLRSWTNSVPRIPRAIAIAPGQCYGGAIVANGAKFTIPTNPAASDVAKIAAAITTSLPNFGARGGAMNANAYINNIAANIVDYVDADSTPSVDNANPPAWRGCELIAWPNEIFTRFHFEVADTKAVPKGFQYSFKYKHYLEVWNIHTINVPLINLSILNNRNFTISIAPKTFNLSDNTFGPVTTLTLTPVAGSPTTLKPGEFGMLETTTTSLVYTNTSTNVAKNVVFQESSQNISVITTTAGQELSRTKMGAWTREKTVNSNNLYNPVNGVIFATSLGYAVQPALGGTPTGFAGGDPRAAMFLGKDPAREQIYLNTSGQSFASPGGINWEPRYLDQFSNNKVRANLIWPDGGHYNANDLGAVPASMDESPTDCYNKKKGTWSTNIGLAVVRNGPMLNSCELGNIFDPMQWQDATQLPSAAGGMAGLWTNLSAAATPDARFAGRTTLRIGRPEFTRFAFTNLGAATDLPVPNMGQSAAALLDIFCTTNAIDDGGKININTAPGAVLAALAGGIALKSDPAKVGAEVNATMITAFTNGVMKFRQAYPFYSPSQLPFISTNYGNPNWTNTWNANTVFSTNTAGGLRGITTINDQGMEEWFSKIYGLSTVQSRNFRIYVYAQMVNSNNVPYGRIMRKYYHIYAEQTAETPGTAYSGAGYSMVPERESEY